LQDRAGQLVEAALAVRAPAPHGDLPKKDVAADLEREIRALELAIASSKRSALQEEVVNAAIGVEVPSLAFWKASRVR
jgi:hypothetical protein